MNFVSMASVANADTSNDENSVVIFMAFSLG
jgi:hypothetical protein